VRSLPNQSIVLDFDIRISDFWLRPLAAPSLSSDKYPFFASHLSGKNMKIDMEKTRERFVNSPFVLMALSFIFLALASYARVSLCLVRGTESGQYKVRPIYSPKAFKEPSFFRPPQAD
jgi:hypothetical protein